MKVIVKYGMQNDSAIELLADSSILPTGKPLFVPDWAHSFVGTIAVAARIGRLGKNIAPRFAHRYWDSFTTCLLTQGLDEKGTRINHNALTRGHDGALLVGDAVSKADNATQDIHLLARDNGGIWGQTHIDDFQDLVNRMVSQVSRFMTLKMGDLLCLSTDVSHILAINEVVEVLLKDQVLLKTTIK